MKKLLALVLAMVMTLGLATVSTNAVDKFADNDTIKFTEAATVMKAIGVFDGDDSGNFRPTETLKRSEAAKIVAYLMLTKKTADNLIPSGTRYVDVPANHWAAGYIEYLTSEGVLGGVGDGKFNPDGDITGIDFAKMLLVALGYDAKLENLVLSDYRINTAKLANSIDLFEGNTDMVPTAAITRDEAVLYAFNMIKSPMVEYDSNVRVETGNGGAVTVGNNHAYQKTSSNYSKQTILLKEAARNDQYTSGANYIVEFAEEKYPDLQLTGRYNDADHGKDADSFGRPSRQWLYKNEDLGRFVQTQDLVASWNEEVTAKMVYDKLGKTIYDSLKDKYSALWVWSNGELKDYPTYNVLGNTITANATNNTRGINGYIDRDSTYTINQSGNGVRTELYMDKDKNVTIVTMHVWVYKAASDYNKNSKSVNLVPAGHEYGPALASRTLKLEDFPEIEDFKADDYILIKAKKNENANTYDAKEIEKAELLTGKVDAYTTEGTYNVTIDGTKHKYAYTANHDIVSSTNTFADTAAANDNVRTEMYSVGKEATVVVDKDGYIFAVDEAIVTSDYVFISKFGNGNSNLSTDAYASAYFADGTDSTIKLKAAYDMVNNRQETSKRNIALWNNNQPAHAGWYTYSKNANGEYTLYAPQSGWGNKAVASFSYDNGDRKVLEDGQVYFLENNSTYKADDKTIVVVNDDAKGNINVYTGVKNIPGISLTAAKADANVYVLANNTTNYAKVVYVGLTGEALVTGSANDNLIFVVKSDGAVRVNDDKNETRWQYVVLKNDGTTDTETILADNKITDFNGKVYLAANYASKNADGVYTKFYKAGDQKSDTVASAEGLVYTGGANLVEYKNGALSLGNKAWTLASDAKITVVPVKYSTYDASVMNTDKSADQEYHTWISGSELNGMFTNLASYTYDYALRTTGSQSNTGVSNAGSREIKELYITVRSATEKSGTTVAVNTNGLTVNVSNGTITVNSSTGTTPAMKDQLTAIESRLATLGYTIVGSKVEGGVYEYTTINPNGYTEYLTFDPDDTASNSVVVSLNGETVSITSTGDGTYFTKYENGKATVANGKYVSVNGKDWVAGDGTKTVDLGLYSEIKTADIKVTVDDKDVYADTGDTTAKLPTSTTGKGWLKSGTTSSYVPYDADATLSNGDVYTSGYVAVTGDLGTDQAGYTAYGKEATLTVSAANTKYTVMNGTQSQELTSNASSQITLTSVNGDVSVSAMSQVTVTNNATGWSVAIYDTKNNKSLSVVDGKTWVASDAKLRVTVTATTTVTSNGETLSVTGLENGTAATSETLTAVSAGATSFGTVSGSEIRATSSVVFNGTLTNGNAITVTFATVAP